MHIKYIMSILQALILKSMISILNFSIQDVSTQSQHLVISIGHFMKNNFLLLCTAFIAMQSSAIADVPRNFAGDEVSKLKTSDADKKKFSTTRNNTSSDVAVLKKAPQSATSINMTVSLSSNVQYGSVANNESDGFRYKDFDKAKGKQRSHGFVTNNKIIFQAEGGKEEIGLKYGAYVKINADTSKPIDIDLGRGQISNPVGDKMMLFLEGQFGRLEAGSYDGAHDRIKVSGSSVARATDGIAGDWSDWLSAKAYYGTTKQNISRSFIDSAQLPVNRDYVRANKITYYTPKLNGFTFGVSYIPDAEYTGTVDQIKDGVSTSDSGRGYKDVVEAGIRYSTKINDVNWTISGITEFGNAKQGSYPNANPNPTPGTPYIIERNNLFAWEIGTRFDYEGFSIAGSYGDLGKSGTTKNPKPQVASDDYKYGGSYWTAGAAYKYKDFGISVTYMQSKSAGLVINQPENMEQYITSYNKANIFSIGMDYSVLPGFLPYAEVTHFSYNRPDDNNVKGNNGIVFLVGAKLKF